MYSEIIDVLDSRFKTDSILTNSKINGNDFLESLFLIRPKILGTYIHNTSII
jgi:hypothetical protein